MGCVENCCVCGVWGFPPSCMGLWSAVRVDADLVWGIFQAPFAPSLPFPRPLGYPLGEPFPVSCTMCALCSVFSLICKVITYPPSLSHFLCACLVLRWVRKVRCGLWAVVSGFSCVVANVLLLICGLCPPGCAGLQLCGLLVFVWGC